MDAHCTPLSNSGSSFHSMKIVHILFLILNLNFLSTTLIFQIYLNEGNIMKLFKSYQEVHEITNSSKQHYLKNIYLHVDLQKTFPTEGAISQEVTTPGYRKWGSPQAQEMRNMAMTNMRRHISSQNQSWDKASRVMLLQGMPFAAKQNGRTYAGSTFAHCSFSSMATANTVWSLPKRQVLAPG